MATNANTVPQQVMDEIIMGLAGQADPVIDQIPGIQAFKMDALSGKVPVLPSSSTMSNVTDADAEGLPEGAEPNESEIQWSEISYDNRRYPGYTTITDGVAQAVSRGEYTGLEICMLRAKMDCAAKLNKKLNLLLKNATVNEVQAVANGAWSVETSTPILDMQAAQRKVGGKPNIGIFGDDVLKALQVHGDFLARTSNYEAGFVDEAEIAEQLRRAFGLRYVVVGGQLYNAGPEGTPFALGFEFDGVAWLGRVEHLVKTETNKNSPNVEQDRNLRREATETIYSRRMDIRRSHKECGVIITGVSA